MQLKKILYIGNQLTHKGLNKTTIDTLSALLRQENFEVFTASSKNNTIMRLLDMLIKTYHHRKVDFLLMDTYSTTAFWYAFLVGLWARVLKIKYIPILHGGNLPFRLKKNPRLCRLLFGKAFINIAPSNYLKKEFEDFGLKNLVYIPNTIEIVNYSYLERQNPQPKLLWVRAFASIYNPKMAVDVLVGLQKKYPNAQLCMVGPDKDGSLDSTKKYATQLGVDVTFTGGLSKSEWMELSKNYNFFINTTHFDNTPVSVIEAMALGLPVISTNVGGLSYLLDDNLDSILVNDNEVNHMVKAIESLMENPNKSIALTRSARLKAESFDWNQVKKHWISLLE